MKEEKGGPDRHQRSGPGFGGPKQYKETFTLPWFAPVVRPWLIRRMTDAARSVLIPRICRAANCGALFWICRSCYRGQCYCSPWCRFHARRQQCRKANQRHQQSVEGRLDHRDRQREYRMRLARSRVTDQSSNAAPSSDNLAQPAPIVPGTGGCDLVLPNGDQPFCPVCAICGRPGLWTDPFFASGWPMIPQETITRIRHLFHAEH